MGCSTPISLFAAMIDDQNGLVVDGALQVFEIDQPISFHRQIRDAIAILLKPLARIENSLVLCHLRDDVVAALAVHLRDALDGQVVRLRGARGEDDLFRGGADELCNLLARRFNSLLRFPAKGVVAARRVAKLAGEVGHHRFQHPGVERAGGVIIHIDRQRHACRNFHLAGNCTHLTSPSLLRAPLCGGGDILSLNR